MHQYISMITGLPYPLMGHGKEGVKLLFTEYRPLPHPFIWAFLLFMGVIYTLTVKKGAKVNNQVCQCMFEYLENFKRQII